MMTVSAIAALAQASKKGENEMKVYMINDTIINLAEVQYITVRDTGRVKKTIQFIMKGKDREVYVEVLSTSVSEILQECYEIMKKED
jgi:hypothetical protein